MLYLLSKNGKPLNHLSCGQLINESGFIHPKRQMDSFVLIVGIKGVLSIYQDNTEYKVSKNQYLLLFPGHKHGGITQSESKLSYYWCHFKITNSEYLIADENSVKSEFDNIRETSALADYYILPEYGEIKSGDRISLLFHQMLDNVSQTHYSEHIGNYALSLLATGITSDFLNEYDEPAGRSKKSVSDITNWIGLYYADNLTVNKIAWEFGYNPNYLSTMFKRETGSTLVSYIYKTRINAAKQLLLESDERIKTIGARCGFNDEKHFMKTFKRLEDMTPTEFRGAFYKKYVNNM